MTPPPPPGPEIEPEIELVRTHYGPMLVYAQDQGIGALLRTGGGFGEQKIAQVADFLAARHGFAPRVFIDIGANLGTHLVYSLRSGLFERAIGVEADPANFRLLQANVAINRLGPRTRLLQCALSSRRGELQLEQCAVNFGDHRVRVDAGASGLPGLFDAGVAGLFDAGSPGLFNEAARRVERVPCRSFDAVFERPDLPRPHTLVWIDTQGYEGHIFRGGRRALRTHAPFVVSEFWPYGMERCGGKPGYFEFLAGCSHIYDINAPDWHAGPGISVAALLRRYDELLAQGRPFFAPHTDLLCVPAA